MTHKDEGELTDRTLVVGSQFSPTDFQQNNKKMKKISILHANPSNTQTQANKSVNS